MNITEIGVGDHILVQPADNVLERARVMGFNDQKGTVIIRLSDGKLFDMHPQYILKSFEKK